MTVYVAWGIRDVDPSKEGAALYRYTDRTGLRKLFELPRSVHLLAVEATPEGTICLATSQGIERLNRNDRRAMVCRLPDLYVTSDGLDLPFGLSFHEPTGRVICVRKQSGELLAIDQAGAIEVLNDPSGLARPIAVDEHPGGAVFLNGDEVGLLRVNQNGEVSVFQNRIVSFQPPPADLAFAEDGTIYYTCAAPGFESSIVRIDADGNLTRVTRDVGEPAGIDVAPEGMIYYADYRRGTLCRLRDDGSSVPLLSGLNHPVGLTVDEAGWIWVGVAAPDAVGDPENLDEVYSTRIIRFAPGRFPQQVFSFDEGSGRRRNGTIDRRRFRRLAGGPGRARRQHSLDRRNRRDLLPPSEDRRIRRREVMRATGFRIMVGIAV